jgi:acylphosphatase
MIFAILMGRAIGGNSMIKARFYITNKVQEVGYRAFVIQKILDSDLEGTARNLSDGRVEVLLKGEKEGILDFVEMLKKEKPELSENLTISKIDFGDFVVPDAIRSSQSLMLEQLGKGIVYTAKMTDEMGDIREEMREGISELGGKMDKGFSEVGHKIDKIPEEIAKAIKESK